jgi:hypothetical protein
VRLKAIGEIDVQPSLEALPALYQPYLERLAREELGDDTIRFGVVRNARLGKQQRRKQVIEALMLDDEVVSRADGRPMLVSGKGFLSLSHADGTSVAVYGSSPIACDIAEVDASYPNLAGLRISAEDWAAAEVLRKLGQPAPFSNMPACRPILGALSPVPVVFNRILPALGLVVAVGRLCNAAATGTGKLLLTNTEVVE